MSQLLLILMAKACWLFRIIDICIKETRSVEGKIKTVVGVLVDLLGSCVGSVTINRDPKFNLENWSDGLLCFRLLLLLSWLSVIGWYWIALHLWGTTFVVFSARDLLFT